MRRLGIALFLSACGLSNAAAPVEQVTDTLPITALAEAEPIVSASLWSGGSSSLFGDRRASTIGDILTVVVEIDDRAEFSNASEAQRKGSNGLSLVQLFGIPQRISGDLPAGATLDPAVEVDSSSQTEGDGSIRRNEKLALKIAAMVTAELPNGALEISGHQMVTVNFETRELFVQGIIRPEDISRQNEITYEKIAEARISYGGQGQITDMHRPRLGQQMLSILPF